MNTNNRSRNCIKYNNRRHFAKFDKYLKNMKFEMQKKNEKTIMQKISQNLPLVLFANNNYNHKLDNTLQKINNETFIKNFITDLVALLISLCFVAILVYILTNNVI